MTVYSAPSPNSVASTQSICSGDTPTQLSGSTPTGGGGNTINYLWQSSVDNATFVTASGTSNTQNYQPASLTQNYYFRRQVSAGNCATNTSASILITVGAATVITTQPANFGLCANAGGTVSVAATGSNLSYQWQVSTDGGSTWANVSGVVYSTATTNALTLSNVPASYNNYQYRCLITGSCNPPSIASNAATMTVNSAPVITTQTVDNTVCEGGSASYPITFSAGGTLTYQWSLGGANLTDNAIYSGSLTSTLSLTGIPKTYNGNQYKCTASYLGCTTTSSTFGNLTVNPQAAVATQPTTPAAVCSGSNVVNITNLTATAGATFQWQENTGSGWANLSNGGVYSNVNTASLRLTNITSTYNGYQYRAVVTNTCNPTGDVSNAVTVTVNPAGQWLGTTSTDWNTASNWCGSVPTSTTDVIINAPVPNMPVISNTPVAVCRNLTIGSGASVTITSTNVLTINGNFTNNGTFTANSSVVTFAGSTTQTISGTSTSAFYSIKVDKTSTSALTVSNNVTLAEKLSFGTNISNNLVINNGGGGSFTFLSTVASSAHIDVLAAPLPTITGSFTCQRYFPAENGRYNFMLGVPVTNASVSALQPTVFDGSGNPTNGLYMTGPFTGANTGNGLSLLSFTMFDYKESSGLYTGYPVNGGNVTAPLVFGNGYRVSVRDGGSAPTTVAKTLSVTGTLVTPGAYTYSGLTYVATTKPFASGTLTGISAPVNGGWNLLSNPYMSDISIDMSNGSYWTKSNISTTSYIYNAASRSFGSCASGVPTGNCTIPAFQAFFVQANAASPTLKINEAAKVSASNTTSIRRVAQSDVLNYLGIKLSSSATNTVESTYIRYTQGATYAHDDFDGLKLGATNRGYISDLGCLLKSY